MPLIYMPKFIPEIDYNVLRWLDSHGGKSDISFEMLDELNVNISKLEKSFHRLSKDGLIGLRKDKSAIIGVELTDRAHSFLAEHILIRKPKGKR